MFFCKFSQIYPKALERIRGIDGLTTVSEALQFVSSCCAFTVNQCFAFSITENVSEVCCHHLTAHRNNANLCDAGSFSATLIRYFVFRMKQQHQTVHAISVDFNSGDCKMLNCTDLKPQLLLVYSLLITTVSV